MPKSSAMKRGLALRAGRVDPDVAGVRIGVEEVVAEHLRVEHAHALGGERLAVDAGGVERGDVVGRDAAHAFQRQHALGGVRPDHLRHVQVGESGQKRRSTLALRAFALQVEFGGERGLDLGDDLARADLVGARMGALDQRRHGLSRAMSAAICFSMSGRSTLTTTSRGASRRRQRRRVHLRDRGRGQRRGVEVREGLARSAGPARASTMRARGFAIERRDAVLQQRQFVGDVGRHQVAARGQDLPELDEDRPEFLQRQAQARAARLRGDSRRGARHERPRQLQPALGRRVVEQVVEAIAQQHAADAPGAQHRLHARMLRASRRSRADARGDAVRRRRAGRRHRRGRRRVRRAATTSRDSSVTYSAASRRGRRPATARLLQAGGARRWRPARRARRRTRAANGCCQSGSKRAASCLQAAREFGIAVDAQLADRRRVVATQERAAARAGRRACCAPRGRASALPSTGPTRRRSPSDADLPAPAAAQVQRAARCGWPSSGAARRGCRDPARARG